MTALIARALGSLGFARLPVAAGRADRSAAALSKAIELGGYGTARLHFLKLGEAAQLRALEGLPRDSAVHLAGGLPTYTLARLHDRLPRRLRDAIAEALPQSKREGLAVILNHLRRN